MAKQTKPQSFPLGGSYLNLIVGIIVVVAIAALIVGFIRGRAMPSPTQEQEAEQMQAEEVRLPAKHTVAPGEDLWKISEKYYKTGYNWVDIANENNITNPNAIAEGMELSIPNVPPRVPPSEEQVSEASPTPAEEVILPTPTSESMGQTTQAPAGEAITGTSYAVVAGDYLWAIAVRAYGDGFKWVDIARANNLDNPDIIHRGNVLTIPR